MNLEARKITFIQEFLRLENEEIIIGLENLLRKGKTELIESNYKPMSEEQLNSEIDLAMEDSENGRLIKAIDLKLALSF
uniref:hypothetical protein n=1 Tax=Flavobacterium sp. TaxID=239 RepID=UPI00404A3F94